MTVCAATLAAEAQRNRAAPGKRRTFDHIPAAVLAGFETDKAPRCFRNPMRTCAATPPWSPSPSSWPLAAVAVVAAARRQPAITTQPQFQSVGAGQAVTFSVAADSTTLSYQWQRDGKDIPGATSLTYTLANPQAADNGGKFTAVATGAKASTTSAAAVLGVSMPKGLALVAGTPAGQGNLDGVDGRVMLPGLLAMQPAGSLYLVDAVDSTAFAPALRTIDLATGALATLERIPDLHDARAVAIDSAGNLYDAPWATGPATTIYRTAPGGTDRAGNLTAVDNGVLRSVSAAEVATTRKVVTAPGDPLYLSGRSFAVDGSGNAYVQEGLYPYRIRRIAPDGTVTTLPDDPVGIGYRGKDGTAGQPRAHRCHQGRAGRHGLCDEPGFADAHPAVRGPLVARGARAALTTDFISLQKALGLGWSDAAPAVAARR
jgi:hypothetical protein